MQNGPAVESSEASSFSWSDQTREFSDDTSIGIAGRISLSLETIHDRLPDLESVAEDARGNFLLGVETDETFSLVTDRFGLYPVYYRTGEDWMSVSMSVFDLVDSPTLNRTALAEFLLFGHPIEANTIFEGVKLLPPASVLTWDGNQVEVRKYWDLEFDTVSRPFEEVVTETNRLVKESLRREIDQDDDLILGISGGFDSRYVATALNDIGYTAETASFSISNDGELGGRVAETLNFPHAKLSYSHEFVRNHTEEFVHRTNGMQGIRHLHNLVVPKQTDDTLTALHGYFGDELFDPRPVDELSQMYYSDPEDVRALFDSEHAGAVDEAISNFEAYVADSSDPGRYFDLGHVHRRYFPSFSLGRDSFDRLVFPFANVELVEFLTTVPAETFKPMRRVERNAILELNSAVGEIPLFNTSQPLTESSPSTTQQFSRRVQNQIRKTGLRLSGGRVRFNPSFKEYSYADWMRQNAEYYRTELFGDLPEYLDEDGVADQFDRLLSGDDEPTDRLCDLAAMKKATDIATNGRA